MKALKKIMTPARTIGAIALVGTLALGACGSSGAASAGGGATSATAAVAAAGTNGDTTAPPTAADALASNAKASYVKDSDWKASDAVDVTLSGTTATSSSDAVSVSDGVLTISKAGVYKLSGSFTGKVVVAAGTEDRVVLILDNATITSSSGAAIEARSGDDLVLSLEGTSTITDGTYTGTEDANAVIYADMDLTITGAGTLNVTSGASDAITSKDDLYVLSGTINATASDDGLRGKDSLTVAGGTVTVTSGGDALKSDQDNDDTKGYVNIADGTVTLTSGGGTTSCCSPSCSSSARSDAPSRPTSGCCTCSVSFSAWRSVAPRQPCRSTCRSPRPRACAAPWWRSTSS